MKFKDLNIGDMFNTKTGRYVKITDINPKDRTIWAVCVMSTTIPICFKYQFAPDDDVTVLYTSRKAHEQLSSCADKVETTYLDRLTIGSNCNCYWKPTKPSEVVSGSFYRIGGDDSKIYRGENETVLARLAEYLIERNTSQAGIDT
jgi:hypothetical protein